MFTKFLGYQRLFSILSLCIKTAKCHGVQMYRLGTGTFVPASAYKAYQVFKCPLLLKPSSDRAEIFQRAPPCARPKVQRYYKIVKKKA